MSKIKELFFLFSILFMGVFIHNHSANAAQRTVTFVNKCSYPVWFGLSSGSATNKHPAFPGDTSCTSNNDCFTGSSCTQTGANRQCFWNPPVPSNNNYQLSANGGTNRIVLPILDNGHPQNIIWSGAVAGRTQCTGSGCATADCGAGTGGCPAGVGFQQPATQAEFTLVSKGPDFYNLTVINGLNLPISMAADNNSSNTSTAPYSCGSPGAATQTNPLLSACSWELNPPSNDYRYVTRGGSSCSVDSDCSSGTQCGLSFNPGQNPLLKKSCGTLLGYWTANQICGVQPNYGAPFNCQQRLPGSQSNLTLWNLYSCTVIGSCYQNGAANNCCGCVNWDNTGIKVPPAPFTEQCKNTNVNWNNYAQPTLAWLKRACPTSYVYPYDDMSSTFTCTVSENNVNVANYIITYCPANGVTPPPPPPPPSGSNFSYTVYIGSPFQPVLINGSITCPDPKTGSPACLISKQAVNSHLTIKGSGTDYCDLAINANGGAVVNSNSKGCYVNIVPATAQTPGAISLPSRF